MKRTNVLTVTAVMVTVTVMVIVVTVIVEAVEVIVEILSHFEISRRCFKVESFEWIELPCRENEAVFSDTILQYTVCDIMDYFY